MARPNKFKQNIIKEIVTEDGGTVAETTRVVEHCLSFTRNHIEKGEFNKVALPYFGKFHVKPRRLQYINNEVLHRGKPQSKGRS